MISTLVNKNVDVFLSKKGILRLVEQFGQNVVDAQERTDNAVFFVFVFINSDTWVFFFAKNGKICSPPYYFDSHT